MSEGGYFPESFHANPPGDHLRELAQEGHRTVAVSHFEYPETAEREKLISMAEVAAGFNVIVDWVSSPESLNMVAARAYTLSTWLNPVRARYQSLNQIAENCGVSRASLSKSLLHLKDEHGIKMSIGRLESSRQVFKEAQLLSVQRGNHCSQKIRESPKITKGDEMPSRQEIESKYPTLTRAVDRLVEVENELAQMHETVFKATTAAPTPRPAPAPAPRPIKPARPSPVPRSPSRTLQDLTIEELQEVADLANRQGAQEVVAAAYAQICKAREALKVR